MHKECGTSGGSKPVRIGDLCMGLISRLHRGTILEVFPNTHVVLDVWHFMMQYLILLFSSHTNDSQVLIILFCISRYLTTILNRSRNPHYMDVWKDIVNAILSKTAERNRQAATYWLCKEQMRALKVMYSKWLSHCSVWSQASMKVWS